MKRPFRSSRRSKWKISSTVLISFLSQHVLKQKFRFLEEPINPFPHCWIISTGDATETEAVTALTACFCFCENSLQRKREEGREKSLEKATWFSWSARMLVLFSALPQMHEERGGGRHPGAISQRHQVIFPGQITDYLKKRLEVLGWSNDTTFPRSFSCMKHPFRVHIVQRQPMELFLSKNLCEHSLFPAAGDTFSFLQVRKAVVRWNAWIRGYLFRVISRRSQECQAHPTEKHLSQTKSPVQLPVLH